MSKLKEGMRLPALRAFIDEKYGKGAAMNTPYPPTE